ncbi:hypothetical protein [Nostoc sp.]|uniref:hypothetical protein n=1 Tax=Nostoc sp. TaxID=1180 RepID=UPI002FF6629B
MVRQNGVWTFFRNPRAVCYGGNTYIGWVDNRGVVGITKANNINLLIGRRRIPNPPVP